LRWNYAEMPTLLGAGRGVRVETDGELAAALAAAFADDAVYSIIDVRLGRFDVSAGLRRLAAQLR
jgi:TPP-dependent 2-oxoacid decarboxylase